MSIISATRVVQAARAWPAAIRMIPHRPHLPALAQRRDPGHQLTRKGFDTKSSARARGARGWRPRRTDDTINTGRPSQAGVA
jgi:hypothetical protein